MATEYHLITQNGTAGSYWTSLTTEQKARYYYGGSYLVYANFNAWKSVLTSRASIFTDLVVECEGAWTDSSTYLTATLSGWKSITITTKINGIYGSGFHNGIYGSGYTLAFTGTPDFLRINQPNILIDGLDIRSTVNMTGSLVNASIAAVASSITNCFLTCNGYAGSIGLRLQGVGFDANNLVIKNAGQYGIRLEYSTGDNAFITNTLITGCGTGIWLNSSYSFFSVVGCISIGNTTNWGGVTPSGRSICAYNGGLSGEAWDTTGTRLTVATTDFTDFSGNDFRPASSSSPIINVIPPTVGYADRLPKFDMVGNYRPDYEGATYPTNYYDIGPFEYDHGEGNTPPNYQPVEISGIVPGSRVKIKKVSDGSTIYNDIVSGATLSFSYNAGMANTAVTVDIRKGSAAPYYKPLHTTGTISYLTGMSISVTQIEAIAADIYPAQITTDWSINTSTGAITRNSGGQYTFQQLYSWLLDYYDDATTIDLPMPIEGITPAQFELINSGSISDTDMQYLNGGSLWDGTTLWANLTVVGTLAADTMVYVHVDGTEYTGYWGTGNIDVSLKFQNFDGTEVVDVRAHKYTDTYDHWRFDGLGEGLNYAALSTADDPNNQTAEVTVANYDITVTVDNPTDKAIDAEDTPADYTTTVDAGALGVQEVYEYLKYLTKEKSTYVSANASYAEVKDAPYGTFAGGIFFGARGIWLENVASGDALNYVLTDNDGVTHQASAPPVQISVTNLVVGERFQIYDQTNNIELVNTVATGTSYSLEKSYTQDLDIRLRHIYVSGATATVFQEEFGTFTSIGLPMRATQEPDPIYNVNGINGSTVTGIAIDDTHLLVSVTTGSMSLQEIYAYETYWLSTEAGIRDEGRFIDATDVANYVWHEFKLKNTSSPSVPLVITGGYVRDADTNTAIAVLDTSGGTVFFAPDHVVAYAAGAEATVAIVQAGLTAQGYTTGRAPKIDNLDIPVSEAGGGSGLTLGQFLALK